MMTGLKSQFPAQPSSTQPPTPLHCPSCIYMYKEKKEQEIVIAHNAEVHPTGEGLPKDQQVFRVKVTFLCAGIPLTKHVHI